MGDATIVADFMVRDPACAEPWQPVALARHRMLMSSFSYLPMRVDGEWKRISDYAIAMYLARSESRRRALAWRIEVAHSDGALSIEPAPTVSPRATVKQALDASAGKPVLVVAEDRLIGIATPFDML